ncbi:hypothetical protein Pcinc_038446 [Petrolisthes cinctipes]|uniref:Secreted protein n=1 Tax=Petrolisthes cinctipes TaxID=88211 RepID=A0AAE1BQS5_PETCI|nr:hypothetical protein Pcinc_038446 [Petrolisthes cinctipes]
MAAMVAVVVGMVSGSGCWHVAGGCGSNDWWLPEVDESEEMQATSQLRSDCLAGNVRVVGAASLTLLDSPRVRLTEFVQCKELTFPQ